MKNKNRKKRKEKEKTAQYSGKRHLESDGLGLKLSSTNDYLVDCGQTIQLLSASFSLSADEGVVGGITWDRHPSTQSGYLFRSECSFLLPVSDRNQVNAYVYLFIFTPENSAQVFSPIVATGNVLLPQYLPSIVFLFRLDLF